MARPCCLRKICGVPGATYFKPAGIPLRELDEVVVALDELEALRLADLQGLYQEQAAEQMRVSRPTFGRIVEQARRKVAEALIHGKALRLQGGPVTTKGEITMPETKTDQPQKSKPGSERGACGCGQHHRHGERHGTGERRGQCCGQNGKSERKCQCESKEA